MSAPGPRPATADSPSASFQREPSRATSAWAGPSRPRASSFPGPFSHRAVTGQRCTEPEAQRRAPLPCRAAARRAQVQRLRARPEWSTSIGQGCPLRERCPGNTVMVGGHDQLSTRAHSRSTFSSHGMRRDALRRLAAAALTFLLGARRPQGAWNSSADYVASNNQLRLWHYCHFAR